MSTHHQNLTKYILHEISIKCQVSIFYFNRLWQWPNVAAFSLWYIKFGCFLGVSQAVHVWYTSSTSWCHCDDHMGHITAPVLYVKTSHPCYNTQHQLTKQFLNCWMKKCHDITILIHDIDWNLHTSTFNTNYRFVHASSHMHTHTHTTCLLHTDKSTVN